MQLETWKCITSPSSGRGMTVACFLMCPNPAPSRAALGNKMKNSIILLSCGLLLVSVPSAGDEKLKLDVVQSMVNIYGECIGVRLADIVATPRCQRVVVDVTYKNGRRNIIGLLKDEETLITFSGIKETSPMPEKYELALDRVTLASRGKPIQEVPGSGNCAIFGKLEEGLTILCILKTEDGNYELAFLGNGDVKWEKKK
jgi:hypothetical protein